MTDGQKEDKWERIHQVFNAALERAPEERASFLQDECAGDDALLREVDSLLSAHESAGHFLESGLSEVDIRKFTVAERGTLTGSVGSYELQGVLGRGGMGEVY